MADLKRRTLYLNSGRQIKLFGNSIAINKSLELGEGCAPNILSLVEEEQDNKDGVGLSNPRKLTVDELMDLADFNIQLWMNLKAGLRRYNQVDPRIFSPDLGKASSDDAENTEPKRKRKTAANESLKS